MCRGRGTYPRLLIINLKTQHKHGHIVLLRPKHIVGDSHHAFGPNRETRLLQRLPFGTGPETRLSNLEMAAGELPRAWGAKGQISSATNASGINNS